MKKIIITLAIMVVFAATLSANGSQDTRIQDGSGYGQGQGNGLRDGSGQGRGNGGQGNGGGQGQNGSGTAYREDFVKELSLVYGIEPGSGVLNEAEEDGLMLMREEEKLAKDVYLALYEKWNLPVFQNISESEQQHMDAVALIIDTYKLDDPVKKETPGVFVNKDLQKLYDNLVKQGSKSIEDALTVGATIEDLDIADLQKLLDSTRNTEVKILYQNLMKGSRNHMRSFTAQLDRYDVSYKPVYIDDDYYAKILKYNREMAPVTDPDYSL